MFDASILPSVNAGASILAAVAALVTILYARATVREARDGRRENRGAHLEEIAEMRQATTAAVAEQQAATEASAAQHRVEMAERDRALAAELAVQRLTQLDRISELLLLLADVARDEARNPPERLAPAISGTRLPGILRRLRNAITVLEALGGPELLAAGPLARRGYGGGSDAVSFLGDALDALEEIDKLVRAGGPLTVPPTAQS